MRRTERGMSLVELLLVVTIIGLIATIAVPQLMKSRHAAEKAATKSTMRTMHINQATYLSQNGRYARLDELNAFTGNTLGTTVGYTMIRGEYRYFLFPTGGPWLKDRYWLISIKYENNYPVTAFLMTEQGTIQTLIDR